jgi:epoxyqueuosine reductase
MNPTDLAQQIRSEVQAAGFVFCGFAPPTRSRYETYVRRFMEEGRHASMSWLAARTEMRLDPSALLDTVKTVVVLAAPYPAPPPHEPRIAGYALGSDYHKTFRAPLKHLAATLTRLTDAIALPFCDTAPLLERELAARTRLGWIGKNSMLVSRSLGQWFLLAEILTPAALPFDPPEPDRCGSCSRCLDACPTHAIPAPYQLDPRRCLAYWTIEHRGPWPDWVREAVGPRLFGCDDCLAACPWNRFAQATHACGDPKAFLDRLPSSRELLQLDEEQFLHLFGATPLRRVRLAGFRRNLCAVLGHIGTDQDLPALEQAALDGDPAVAENARWAITRLRQNPRK